MATKYTDWLLKLDCARCAGGDVNRARQLYEFITEKPVKAVVPKKRTKAK